jgi:hypothetical protein
MPRYIDADSLLKKRTTIRVTYHCQGADEWDDYEAVLVKDIKEAPTLSPDEVRGVGEWLTEYEPNGRPYQLHCSVCDSDFSHMGITTASNYCPFCGARMKGASEDE